MTPRKPGRKFLPPALKRSPLAISLTPAERAQIEAAAENDLEPVAVYIRNAALERVRRQADRRCTCGARAT